jgi:multiple sugar transport system ATP-binding protein
MAEVILDSVTKVFAGDVVAVRGASLDVRDREIVVLVGPSGCGKSTTLRMIAGLEDATSGDIFIDGRRVNDVPPKDRDIAMVFQNYALYPHMTVYRNMAFGLRLRRMPRDQIDVRVRDAAQVLGIQHLLDRKPRALSGGERQRVAVGRAIVRHPKVFLFDEPLSNLDAKLRVQMRAEISRLHTRLEATMIYVTHDQTEAMTMGDRIVVMDRGVIQQTDDPLRLYNRPANRFVAGFIGSPATNFVEGRLASMAERRLFRANGLEIALPPRLLAALQAQPDGPITLGVRPEHVRSDADFLRDRANARISALVEVVEPLGDEALLHLRAAAQSLVAKTSPALLPPVGGRIDVAFDLEHAHFFHPDTGANLTLQPSHSGAA